jgi:cytochrome c2
MKQWHVTIRPKGRGQSRTLRAGASTSEDASAWAAIQLRHWGHDPAQYIIATKEATE